MSSSRYEEEGLLIQKCLAGEQEALAFLRSEYLLPLRHLLVTRGASATQAEDIVSNLWADCVVGHKGHVPLLEKYNGRSTLKNWLFRVGINLLVDMMRRGHRHTEVVGQGASDYGPAFLAEEPATWTGSGSEGALVGLLRDCLAAAFERCPAEDLLRLRLVYLHGLTHREVARMWGCHESTLSRDLGRCLQAMADETLQAVHKHDPQLRLTWDDFIDLCDTQRLDFL